MFSFFKGAKGAKDAKLFKVLREVYLLAPLMLYLLVSGEKRYYSHCSSED